MSQQVSPREAEKKLPRKLSRREEQKRQKRRRRFIAAKRTQWILGIATSAKNQRGLAAEMKVLEALEAIRDAKREDKKTGKIRYKVVFPGGRIIEDVSGTVHYSPEDYAGIDIIVRLMVPDTQVFETLLIQVQNWGGPHEERQFREKGICLVIVRPEEIKEDAYKKVIATISAFLELEDSTKPFIGSS